MDAAFVWEGKNQNTSHIPQLCKILHSVMTAASGCKVIETPQLVMCDVGCKGRIEDFVISVL